MKFEASAPRGKPHLQFGRGGQPHISFIIIIPSSSGPSGIQIFNPGIFGTGFCQIPGSRDFSGRDLPLFLIPGFFRNFSGIFRDFCFCFVCGSNHIIFTNLHHYHCHHHNRPHHHWPRPPFSFIALRKKRQNNCNKGFVCKQYFYQMQ